METFHKTAIGEYHKCSGCSSVFLDKKYFVPPEAEKKRYEKHKNSRDDGGYLNFLSPVIGGVERLVSVGKTGLDFGAGPSPVMADVLRGKGHSIDIYDPFFWNDKNKLSKKYEFIICTEVIEHFHFPEKEFALLRSLLAPGGTLFIMTEVYSEKINFATWPYANDETHVFFYHNRALEWIRANFGFSSLEVDGRLIILRTSA
ncbi:MAG: class I SAM-dependent methyltransferase [Candidatus Omnitrophica bacterium]|nr:class I SAM-dependent methyltransferase [Candidatus Omnitrophota bacterium]